MHLQVLRRRADGHSDYPSVLFADPGPGLPAHPGVRPDFKRRKLTVIKADTDMWVSKLI